MADIVDRTNDGDIFDVERHRDRIERRAYELWEQEGRPDGGHQRHWEEAQRQVFNEIASDMA